MKTKGKKIVAVLAYSGRAFLIFKNGSGKPDTEYVKVSRQEDIRGQFFHEIVNAYDAHKLDDELYELCEQRIKPL